MLTIEGTVLVMIDVQGRLAQVMDDAETLFANCRRLIQGAQRLEVPLLVTEQIPDKVGETVPELKALVEHWNPISKTAFSCCGEPEFVSTLQSLNRKQVVLFGIETHVCVYQTARHLLDAGFNVHLVADAVSSRNPRNREIAVQAMMQAGAVLTCTETLLFELMQDARHEKFRDVLKLVK
jgi:nicotinamidase-related amidase